jgi:hypothetical protein
VGNGHDRAPTAGKGRVKVFAAVDGHAPDQLFGGEAAQEKEVHEHAAVILEGTPRDSRDLRGGAVLAEGRGVVFQRRATLCSAEPEPRRAAGRCSRMA